MSALGQKQTLGKVRLMSALPPKADINSTRLNSAKSRHRVITIRQQKRTPVRIYNNLI
jgi:hypothetical protein